MIENIPYGPYCYTIKEIVSDEDYGIRIKTNNCPYRIFNEEGFAICTYLKTTEFDILLDDSVKICGENELDYEEDLN